MCFLSIEKANAPPFNALSPPLGRRQGKGLGFAGCLLGGAIANETGVRFGEVKCGYVASFVHPGKSARLVTPSQSDPLPAPVSLQMENVGYYGGFNVFGVFHLFILFCFGCRRGVRWRCGESGERLSDCKLFLHKRNKIVRKSLRLQRFALYLSHWICGL